MFGHIILFRQPHTFEISPHYNTDLYTGTRKCAFNLSTQVSQHSSLWMFKCSSHTHTESALSPSSLCLLWISYALWDGTLWNNYVWRDCAFAKAFLSLRVDFSSEIFFSSSRVQISCHFLSSTNCSLWSRSQLGFEKKEEASILFRSRFIKLFKNTFYMQLVQTLSWIHLFCDGLVSMANIFVCQIIVRAMIFHQDEGINFVVMRKL